VADEPRPPVAIRIARPYSTEDQYLEREVETITRTSVVLVGAQSRPQGVILRFEIALQNGTSLLRGEGRVVGYRENAFEDLPGLTLRFTRLDSRSKALVDKAAAIREARARAAFEASLVKSDFPPAPGPPSPPSIFRPSAPPPAPPSAPGSFPPAPDEPTSIGAPPPDASSQPSLPPAPESDATASDVHLRAPDDKTARLARLRERARKMTPDRVASILDGGPQSSKRIS